jgi:hypothetical protein
MDWSPTEMKGTKLAIWPWQDHKIGMQHFEEVSMSKRSTSFVAAILAVTLLGAGPAAAQTASPEAVTAARELVVVMRAAEQFKAVLPIIMQQLKPAIVQGRPEVERDFDAMLPMLQGIMSAQSEPMTKLLDDIAMVYANNFTADEMRRLIAFYREPIGQKFLDKTPVITQQSMAAGQQFGRTIAIELQRRMVEELRKRGHKI